MIFLFNSDQYEMLYIYFFLTTAPQNILLEHVSMHMIKRKCNMYMEAIKQSEDKGIMMGEIADTKVVLQLLLLLHKEKKKKNLDKQTRAVCETV